MGVKGMGIPGRRTFRRLQAALPAKNRKRQNVAAYFILLLFIAHQGANGRREPALTARPEYPLSGLSLNLDQKPALVQPDAIVGPLDLDDLAATQGHGSH